MKKFIAIVLALVMILAFAACSKAPASDTTFTMGIDAEYPPFSYMDDNGEYSGFDVEICRACCEILGWDFQVFGVDWDNKLIQLDAKECDCVWSGMTILPSMSKAGYVISNPYFKNDQVIMVKEGSDIKSSADLKGKVVYVMSGTSGQTLLDEDQKVLTSTFKDGKYLTAESFLKCFTELGGGSADAVIVDKPVAVSYASENKGFVVLDEVIGSEEYGIAFRNGEEDKREAIEGAIKQLVESGKYKEIADKYPDIEQANLTYLN